MEKSKKTVIRNGIIFGCLIVAILAAAIHWGIRKIKYADTEKNRSFTYEVKMKENSVIPRIYIKQNGNLLPKLEDLYAVAKKVSNGKSVFFYFSVNGKDYHFAGSLPCGETCYVKLTPFADFENESVFVYSYSDKHGQYPDEETVKKELKKDELKKEEPDAILIRNELCVKYAEMQSFRFEKDFHEFGFAGDGKYGKWMRDVEGIIQKANRTLHKYNFNNLSDAPDVLLQIALEYMNNGGQDTEFTRKMVPEFEKTVDYQKYQAELKK